MIRLSRHTGPLHRLWLISVLVVPLHTALAHSFDPALLDLSEHDAGMFAVRWKLPATLTGDDAELAPEFPQHCRRIGSAESHSSWQLDCGPTGLRGQTLAVPGIDGTRVDVIVRLTWRDGTTVTGVLRSGAHAFEVPRGDAVLRGLTAGTVLSSYLRLGIEHILLGIDHLLFVLALMLLVDSGRTLLKTISAFTAAHSITLALAVLDVVRIPQPPVEALIALSIVLLAAELTRAPHAQPTLTRQRPWIVAFVFGLLHGLGFASALSQIGLPPDQIGLALLAFNLGVELGQLAFVSVMLAPVTLFARIAWPWAQVRVLPAYAIGALAVAWMLERIQRFWL